MKISEVNTKRKEELKFQDPKIQFTDKELWSRFRYFWKQLNPLQEFKETPEAINNLKTLIFYFSEDKRFFDCENLWSSKNTPSFEKGLLIIGTYGTGKSSYMAALQLALNGCDKSFMSYHAMGIVDEYEACGSPSDKEVFNKKYIKGTFNGFKAKAKYFDDLKTERDASNYGKINLFKDILEKRYSNHALTHLTCNYDPKEEGNLEAGIYEFSAKYGPRVYDRIFSMFNIVEFKGKTFRT